MKNFLISILLAFSTLTAHGAIKGVPFQPEVDVRFNSLEKLVGPYGAGINGLTVQPVAKAIVKLTGDASTGTYNTGIVLPANAIITNAWFDVVTPPTPSGTTIAFQCLTANDIFSAASETAASPGALIQGIPVAGSASTGINTTTTGCTVKVAVGVHAATAGVIDLFLSYVLAN